jgi:hypothetical protein
LVWIGAAVVAALALFLFRGPAGRAALAAALDAATGARWSFAAAGIGLDGAMLTGVRVTRRGDPLFTARRVALAYRLRDALPGGARRWGLVALELDAPVLYEVRRADGSFSLGLPVARAAGGTAGAAAATPLRVDIRIRAGSVRLLDPSRQYPASRRLSLDGVEADVSIDGAARSTYRARAHLNADPALPVTFAGYSDAARGFALYRLRAGRAPLPVLLNYLVDAPAAEFFSGEARDLDIQAYGFDGTGYHVAGGATLAGGAMRVPGLVRTLRGLSGRVGVSDSAVSARALQATIGDIPATVAGGVYDLAHPTLRLGITATAPLGALRRLFAFSRSLPVAGDARITTLIEGPAGAPLVLARVHSAQAQYAAFPVRAAGATIAYHDGSVSAVESSGRYGPLHVAVSGTIDLGETTSQLLVDAEGLAAMIPYAAQTVPGTRLHAEAVLLGRGLRFSARGEMDGGGPAERAGGFFDVDAFGDGAFGPFWAERTDGTSVVGAFDADRSHSRSALWLDARDYRFALSRADPRLPGLALAPPRFSGRLDGSVAGTGPPSAFRLAGNVRGRDLEVGTFRIARAEATLAGGPANLRLAALAAAGAWGDFTGRGAYDGARLALEGSYRGSFERLASLTGDLGARGPVAGPLAVLFEPSLTVVQTRGAVTGGATVRGVPVDRIAGTIAVAGRRLRIYAAGAGVAGGRLAAAGSLGGGGRVGVSLAGVDAARLDAVAPLQAGRIAAIGSYRDDAGGARFDGGLALGAGRSSALDVAGEGDVSLRGADVILAGASALVGGTYGRGSARFTGLGSRAAAYDLDVDVIEAQIAPVASLFAPRVRALVGTASAALHLRGSATGPGWLRRLAVTGRVSVPEGSIDGLAFRDGAAWIAADGSGALAARDGSVTVGSTHATFAAAREGGDASGRVAAPAADLADFNDLFDMGDTLAGRGRINARFVKHGTDVATNADVDIANLRYRRFDLGDALARWTSHGRTIRGSASFDGASGRLKADGTLALATARGGSLRSMAVRSHFLGTALLGGLDLGVWLPALGYDVPVGGRVDAQAIIRGTLAAPEVSTSAALLGGHLGSFPVDTLTVQATSTSRRTTVTRALLQLPALTLTGEGGFGFGARDPVAFAVHAKTPDAGALAPRILGAKLAVTGTAEADVKIGGTLAKPTLGGGFDFEGGSVAGVNVTRALGEFVLQGRNLELRDAEIGFSKGTLYLAGSLPLTVAPFALGPRDAPIALDVSARGIDLDNFAPLLPKGSTLRGLLSGRAALAGTAGNPLIVGRLALAGGALSTPLETAPLTGLAAELAFAGHTATLGRLHADAGGGTIEASGQATFPDLIHPGADAQYAFSVAVAKARLNLPAYGDGTVDGSLVLAHAPPGLPKLSGQLTLSDGVIPFSALLAASAAGGAGGFDLGAATAAPLPAAPIALDLRLVALRNVRVRSTNVDIGGQGAVVAGGTTADPNLNGAFALTGGTLTYFNTVFRLDSGSVTFEPDAGLVPNLDVQATSHVIDPDPNAVRNATGSADVSIALTGPVTNLNVALSSNPPYGRDQILGLLLNAPALGATSLFSGGPGSPTLYGSTATVTVNRGPSGEITVGQEAFGIANAQFTRALLAPIESQVGGALGLTNLNVNVNYTGNVGVSASKVLGKSVEAIYGTTFGYPYRQTFGFQIKPNVTTAAQVTVFETLGAYGLSSLTPVAGTEASNQRITAAQPAGGTVGFSLSLQKLFW